MIELGYFHYVHHDDAKEASKYFERAISLSVDQLTQALVGHAEALAELGHETKASRSLMTACGLIAQYRSSVRDNVLERIKDLMETVMDAPPASANGTHK